MDKGITSSKRSTSMKASMQLRSDRIDEYKRNVDPPKSNRRLYSPHEDPIVYMSKLTAESPARKRLSLSEDDFVPRESQVPSGKLYDPYTDRISWQETSYGQMQRALGTENSEMKFRGSSKHSRTKSANESLMTKGITNDKELVRKEITRQDSNSKPLNAKELAQLENKVSEAFKRFTECINSNSTVNIYDESFWQEKISLHLSLADKYFKYIHLNYLLSVKNEIETKCWKLGFYYLIEQFRSAINLDRHQPKNRKSLSFVISNQFSIFLDEAESFYKRLLKQIANDTKLSDKSIEKNKPPKWIRCVNCLGDITRYRWTHGLEDQERTKEYWAESASRWYRLGIHLNSNNGKFYNHLAILAGQDELRTLYYYCRSLMVNTPFMNARESLVVLFGHALGNIKQKSKGNRGYLQRDNLKAKNHSDKQSTETLFVQLHGILFTKIGFEYFDEKFQSFLDKLLKMNIIQNTNNSNRHWMEINLFLAVINLSGLYNYGNNENSTIGKAIKLQATKNMDDIDVDSAFVQESRLTFVIMNKYMLKYLESEEYQAGHDVSEGWLLYCEIIMLWMVSSGIFDGFADGSDNSVWERIVRKSDFPGSWEILASFLTNVARQISPITKEKILKSVNNDVTEQESFIQIQSPPLAEDWELRGISLLQSIYEHNLFEHANRHNINFADSEVEDTINIFYDVEHDFSCDQDEKTRRRVRIMELGYILTKKITGLDFDVERDSFTASSDLNINVDSDDIEVIALQTAELSIEDDENDALKSTEITIEEVEFEEYSEDNNEGIMELKSRRQELETLLAASRNNVHGFKTKSQAKKFIKQSASEKNALRRVVPGYTTIVVDTNCLIGDLEIVKRLIQSEKWIIVVPSIVVTELTGLKFNPPPLGLAASEALAYLNELLPFKKIKIQTSKGNYLTDINFSEEFDFGDGEDKKKNLDDLILGICLWHEKHHENNGFRNKSNVEGINNGHKNHKNEVIVLLTHDRNLRVKARARGVDVVGVKDFTGLI